MLKAYEEFQVHKLLYHILTSARSMLPARADITNRVETEEAKPDILIVELCVVDW